MIPDTFSNVQDKDWLPDQLQTSINLIRTALLVIECERRDLLPTILEFLYEMVQQIMDENCVVK